MSDKSTGERVEDYSKTLVAVKDNHVRLEGLLTATFIFASVEAMRSGIEIQIKNGGGDHVVNMLASLQKSVEALNLPTSQGIKLVDTDKK